MSSKLSKIVTGYYSKICAATGLVTFVIKDALEYSGISVDKKTSPVRLYRNFMYNFEVLEAKMEKMKKFYKKYIF